MFYIVGSTVQKKIACDGGIESEYITGEYECDDLYTLEEATAMLERVRKLCPAFEWWIVEDDA